MSRLAWFAITFTVICAAASTVLAIREHPRPGKDDIAYRAERFCGDLARSLRAAADVYQKYNLPSPQREHADNMLARTIVGGKSFSSRVTAVLSLSKQFNFCHGLRAGTQQQLDAMQYRFDQLVTRFTDLGELDGPGQPQASSSRREETNQVVDDLARLVEEMSSLPLRH